MAATELPPVFAAVLADEQTLEPLLAGSARLARARMPFDFLTESIPHWLYVGDTPLHLAAASLRGWAARMLVHGGADVSAVNRRGATALHYACDPRPNSGGVWDPPGQADMISLLVDSGAPIDAVDHAGVSALHRAVRARSPAAVRQLLRYGAPVNAMTRRGATALQMARNSTGAGGTAGTADEQREIIELLVGHGAQRKDQ